VSADRTSRVTTSTKTSLRLHRRLQRAPGSRRVYVISARQLGHPSSSRTCRKSTRVLKPVRILAGVRHRHYGSGWRHRHNGNKLPCCLVRAGPDLAHEPYPGVDLLLGRALCEVHSELCQRLSAAWRGGSPPRSEAGAQGNSLGIHLPLHQGMRHYTSYFRCFHHHRFPPGST
jgi:hypothetical protein